MAQMIGAPLSPPPSPPPAPGGGSGENPIAMLLMLLQKLGVDPSQLIQGAGQGSAPALGAPDQAQADMRAMQPPDDYVPDLSQKNGQVKKPDVKKKAPAGKGGK